MVEEAARAAGSCTVACAWDRKLRRLLEAEIREALRRKDCLEGVGCVQVGVRIRKVRMRKTEWRNTRYHTIAAGAAGTGAFVTTIDRWMLAQAQSQAADAAAANKVAGGERPSPASRTVSS